ncbi:hypothetical protein [Streptomyces sp. NPDC051677]
MSDRGRQFYASTATGEFSRCRWSVTTDRDGSHPVSARPLAAARIV